MESLGLVQSHSYSQIKIVGSSKKSTDDAKLDLSAEAKSVISTLVEAGVAVSASINQLIK
jgi:flavin-binding protein dodecin